MKRSAVGLISLLVGVLVLLGAPQATAVYSPEADLVNRINTTRASVGASQLEVDPALSAVAQQWAETMARTNSPTHNPQLRASAPEGFQIIGENVGMGADVAIIDLYLHNSPAHYSNMINPAFNKVGVGVAMANGLLYIVENFLGI